VSEIAVVLDTSALLSYADGHVAVGELISEIAAERRLVGVPAACLTAAGAHVHDKFGTAQLTRLIDIDTVCVLPLTVDDALEAAQYARAEAGDIAIGQAVLVALQHEAYYATAAPKQASSVLPAGWVVIDLSA